MEYEDLLKRARSKVKIQTAEDRFRIPQLDIIVSGKTTVLRNFGELAGTLRREPKHIAKFLFRELAIPGNLEENRLTLFRNFDRETIERAVKNYCNEFLYCSECGKPDTSLVKKDNIMFMKCEACGAERSVKKV